LSNTATVPGPPPAPPPLLLLIRGAANNAARSAVCNTGSFQRSVGHYVAAPKQYETRRRRRRRQELSGRRDRQSAALSTGHFQLKQLRRLQRLATQRSNARPTAAHACPPTD